jgi:UDPglucose 6-dehydrogenase
VAAGRAVHFACSPENLRLGRAIEIFNNPGRIIIGVRGTPPNEILEKMLRPICSQLIWMAVESAEMTKHALNAFLATCVVFINEVATVCEEVGADAADVEKAIRSDPRVGTNTYVTPGAAFAGGTLARDVTFLNEIGAVHALPLPMLGGIIPSNAEHRRWAMRRLRHLVKPLAGRTIAVLGLSYKPGTDAIRRSVAIELCKDLIAEGAKIRAYDPQVRAVPSLFSNDVLLCASAKEAMAGVQAVVIATEWPQFREISADDVLSSTKRPLILDQARFLAKTLGADNRVEYFRVGTSE